MGFAPTNSNLTDQQAGKEKLMCSIDQSNRSSRRVVGLAIAILSCIFITHFTAPASAESARKFPDFLARGLCAVLGGDRDLLITLVPSTNLFFHVLDPQNTTVAELRALAEQAGIGIDRLVIEQGPLDKLPYADNMVDIIVATRLAALEDLSPAEILRTLRPEGTAIVIAASDLQPNKLEQWARTAGIKNANVAKNEFGLFLQIDLYHLI